MPKENKTPPQIENRILLSLPKPDYEQLLPDLEFVPLPLSMILHEAGDRISYAYFINTGVASLIASNSDGGSVEIGLIGKEGLLESQVLMGAEKVSYRSIVQIAGQGLRISCDALKRHFNQSRVLHDQLLRSYRVLHNQISQSVVCNRFHTFEQRLCRWLLLTAARVDDNNIPYTHEFISLMLGANRATVTATLGSLRDAELISQGRGLIKLLDRAKIETVACECYRINKRDLEDFYALLKQEKPVGAGANHLLAGG
jgi:CRP-like cAMP-binding protein